jgi:hypothetical protein
MDTRYYLALESDRSRIFRTTAALHERYIPIFVFLRLSVNLYQ